MLFAAKGTSFPQENSVNSASRCDVSSPIGLRLEPVEATARPTWGTPAPHMAQAVRGVENPPTSWAHTHLIYRRKNMAYTKPQIVAQNSAAGSYSAGCPADSAIGETQCKNCERTS